MVLRAKNGKQALEILRERRPDVMLIDLVMPDMDGFQVVREKNRDEAIRDIPVHHRFFQDRTGRSDHQRQADGRHARAGCQRASWWLASARLARSLLQKG